MSHGVPLKEGQYLVERGFLVAPDNTAVALDRAFIEVFSDRNGIRRLKGSSLIVNALVVELHEAHDTLDLWIDLGEEFKYRLDAPMLQAGKVFAPDVKSVMQFIPTGPLTPVDAEAFEQRVAAMTLISQ